MSLLLSTQATNNCSVAFMGPLDKLTIREHTTEPLVVRLGKRNCPGELKAMCNALTLGSKYWAAEGEGLGLGCGFPFRAGEG